LKPKVGIRLPLASKDILKHRTIVESELFEPLVGTIGKDNDIVITNLATENHPVIEDPVKEVRLTEDFYSGEILISPKPYKVYISFHHVYIMTG
tara:strand:+ start:305 stop:586 length:282 start_codon:yes stop_codon:yes gene_type:complete